MARGLSKNSLWLPATGCWLTILLLPTAAGAHRLDEYLQATRVGIERDRVTVDVDLTAGVSIARQVAGWIDVDGDGRISSSESLLYGRQVLGSLAVSIDGTTTPLSLNELQASTPADMAAGVGTLRLHASASIPASLSGRHQLTLVNTHHPESSVYLANALVPSDKAIDILAQRRSQDQHSLTIDYEVGMSAFWTRVSWLLSAATLLAGAIWTRRRLGHFSQRQTRPI
jgi:hypothetical protein